MKAFISAAFVAASLVVSAHAVAQTQDLRIGNATANDTQAAVNDKFAELLTKYSNGRFKAAAFHGESLGGNGPMIRQLQAGSLHGMIFPAGFMAPVVPEVGLFDMPFLLPGEVSKITAFAAQSKAAAKMKESAAEKGILILGFHGIGAQSLLTNFPVAKLADLQGKKFRVIPSPPRVGAYKDWGAVARPMELGEVFTSLQQRTLDGMENPPDVIYKMKMHEAAKYYTITEHFAFVSNIIVSKKWYDGLAPELKQVVDRAGKETIAWADEAYTKSQADSLEALRKAALVTKMPDAELQKMKDAVTKGVWVQMKEDPKRAPMIDLLREDVASFAKQK